MKIVKLWPCKNTEIRISVNEKMEDDFLKCIEQKDQTPECYECSWYGIAVGREGLCDKYTDKIRQQLKGEVK